MASFLRPALLALLLGLTLPASALEVGGINFPPSTDVQGSTLQLNGAGVRYKAVFKVYAAGLYTPRKVGSLEEILKAPGPKRMSITMLREIDAAELGKLFSRGMEDNMDRAAFAQLIPGILRMSQIFSDHKKLQAGDNFTLDWVPNQGLMISVKGKPQGAPFKEPEFFAALMGIWLGKSPADWQLKNALLDVKS
ncbi:MAG: chalcone isomerase family protein [Hylemonella sp.]|uniref:chalcone isomerase family protein n=1 Tax=Hylemonella sp. TaxID=2066020 RepID=UPI003918B5B9